MCWHHDLKQLADFIEFTSTKNIKKEQASSTSFNLYFAHSPIFVEINKFQSVPNSLDMFPNKETNWSKRRKDISLHVPTNVPLKNAQHIDVVAEIQMISY